MPHYSSNAETLLRGVDVEKGGGQERTMWQKSNTGSIFTVDTLLASLHHAADELPTKKDSGCNDNSYLPHPLCSLLVSPLPHLSGPVMRGSDLCCP